MKREAREVEIDLLQLVRSLLENLKYIVIVTILFGLVGFVGSSLFMEPVYEATAKMIVNTRKDENQNVTSDQLNSAKNLVDTYAVIIRSRDVLNRVITELDLPSSYGQLAGSISVRAVNNTQIMQITVQHGDPLTAYTIAAKILEITPDIIVQTVEAGSVKAVEQAYMNPNPVSPNIMRNAVVLAMIGFLLTCGVIIIVFLADNTYKTDLDIEK